MSVVGCKERYRAELAQAKKARLAGNEGMARVCARRAVGVLLDEYLAQQGVHIPGYSAYDRMRLFQNLPHQNKQIRDTIAHFLIHVQPDRTLPGDFDLVADAEWLASKIFI